MGSQGVSGQQGVHVAVHHQAGERLPGIGVKGAGRAHDPHHVAVIPLVFEQIIDIVVVLGKRGLAGSSLAEGKCLVVAALPRVKAVGVHKNTLLAVLRPPGKHQISLFQVAELPHRNRPVLVHGHAVHPALPGQQPAAVHLEVFGKYGGGVVVPGRHPVPGSRCHGRVRRIYKHFPGKIRGCVFYQFKWHIEFLLFLSFPYYPSTNSGVE